MAESKKKKYVAYVGTYTQRTSVGIHVYYADVETGELTFRNVVEVKNPSYLIESFDKNFLYSISDDGVVAFSIDKDGNLIYINEKPIGGMRGCYLAVDKANRFLFVGGYHDGKLTVMNLNEDGSIGEIADEIYHQGAGFSAVDARLEPKIRCVMLTPDEKYLFAVDNGIDQVKVYKIDYEIGKLRLEDIIRCPFGSSPRMVRFSADGKFVYLLLEDSNLISVYERIDKDGTVEFEKIQEVPTLGDEEIYRAASATIELSNDGKHMFCSVDASNSVSCFTVDKKTGKLEFKFNSKTSGDYPKDVCISPNNEIIFAVNHDSNEVRSFQINYKDYYCLQRKPPVSLDRPNCMLLHEVK